MEVIIYLFFAWCAAYTWSPEAFSAILLILSTVTAICSLPVDNQGYFLQVFNAVICNCDIKGVQKKTGHFTFWFITSVIIIRSEWDAYQIKHFGPTILKCTLMFSSCKYFWRYCRGKTACPKFLPTREKSA